MAHGVLAHVISNGALSPEPAATRALGYILSSSSEVTHQFLADLLEGCRVPVFTPGKILAERWVAPGTMPDLTIEDSEGRRRVFIENKFWANLTRTQPVGYLRALPGGTPSVLLFIVPKPRMTDVWRELKSRCKDSTVALAEAEDRSANAISIAVTVEDTTHALQITNWMSVLRRLDRFAEEAGQDSLRQDIGQLQGLADFQNDPGIELEYSIEQFIELTQDVVEAMRQSPRIRTDRLAWGNTSCWRGRYINVDGFGFGIGASNKQGQERDLTPVCCTLWNTKWGGLLGRDWVEARELFAKSERQVDSKALYVPIHLRMDLGRQGIVNDVVRQILEIADQLREAGIVRKE